MVEPTRWAGRNTLADTGDLFYLLSVDPKGPHQCTLRKVPDKNGIHNST